ERDAHRRGEDRGAAERPAVLLGRGRRGRRTVARRRLPWGGLEHRRDAEQLLDRTGRRGGAVPALGVELRDRLLEAVLPGGDREPAAPVGGREGRDLADRLGGALGLLGSDGEEQD